MIDADKPHPEFTIVLRGYDRDQVDGYVKRLRELLSTAEERARMAERLASGQHR
jgi:DivIVA domain-containing protein